MSERVWYRSLYWRIALGFVLLLAALLAVQAFVSLWLAGRIADLLPRRTPAQFAEMVAADVTAEMAARSDLDVEQFLGERHSRAAQAFAVVTLDGQTALSQRVSSPPMATRAARNRLFGLAGAGGGRSGDGPGGRRSGGGRSGQGFGRGDPAGRGPDTFGRAGGPGRGGPALEFASIYREGAIFGVVAVPAEAPPLSVALRGLGPTLAVVGLVLFVAGTAVAALVVFRPAHRRLRALEQAARALGAGATSVRATEAGGDEVSSLARTFNEMAAGLEARSQALLEADRTRRQLLADISHELATPLAAIRGHAETLAMPGVHLDQATRGRYLDVITDETERLGHIIGDLLDLARFEGGGAALRLDSVSVDALFERLVLRHDPLLREKQITLRTSRGEGAGELRGDATRLEQALQNLVANAVRHTPEGGAVDIRADRAGDRLRIVVEDSGAGIPEEHLPHVFDRFYKVDTSRTGTPQPSGSGLGLSIVQAIVARHEGTVAASNRPEGGARFEVLLPLAGPAAEM